MWAATSWNEITQAWLKIHFNLTPTNPSLQPPPIYSTSRNRLLIINNASPLSKARGPRLEYSSTLQFQTKTPSETIVDVIVSNCPRRLIIQCQLKLFIFHPFVPLEVWNIQTWESNKTSVQPQPTEVHLLVGPSGFRVYEVYNFAGFHFFRLFASAVTYLGNPLLVSKKKLKIKNIFFSHCIVSWFLCQSPDRCEFGVSLRWRGEVRLL